MKGRSGGTRSVFTPAFQAKIELQCVFLGKNTIIITCKHGTTIFFPHYNFIFKENLKKIGPKSARKY